MTNEEDGGAMTDTAAGLPPDVLERVRQRLRQEADDYEPALWVFEARGLLAMYDAARLAQQQGQEVLVAARDYAAALQNYNRVVANSPNVGELNGALAWRRAAHSALSAAAFTFAADPKGGADMAGMLGPHPGVPIEIRETNTMPRRWLLVQRNPIHGWDDQLWIGNSRDAAESKRAALMAGPIWSAAAAPVDAEG